MTPIGSSYGRTGQGRMPRPSLATIPIAIALLTLLSGAGLRAGAQAGPAAEGAVALLDNHPGVGLDNFVPAAGDKTLDLEIVFALRNRAALDKLLADQQDSRSSRYHHWLTASQFAAQFGPAQADFDAVGAWLNSQGLGVAAADIGNRYIRFSATVSDAERIFGGAIVASGDGRLYGNLADPLIPARFAGVIARIEGLDNLRAATPMIRKFAAPPDAAAPASANSQTDDPEIILNGQGPYFGPTDLYAFYDETPLVTAGNNGSGYSCIALVEDSNYLDSAVSSFSSEFGLSAASMTRVFADTSDPGITGDEVEALLDIEWAHVVAPGAPIKVYIGNDGNSSSNGPIVDAIQRAVSDRTCAAISVSFATCGPPASFYRGVVDSIFAQAASQGQSVFLAAGDEGAAGVVFDAKTESCVVGSSRSVSELSADPNVTAVGGTQFTPTYNSSGNDDGSVAESVWNQGGGATGGGESAVFTKPGYQNGVTPGDGMRDVPDIAMIAGLPGVLLYVDENGSPILECCYGGTSLSAPIWAATQALVGGFQGNLNYAFYGSAGPPGVRDVTTGNNSFNGVTGFEAQTGYDQATGFGTIDIAQYVAGRHAAPPTTPTPTAAPAPTPTSAATPAPTPDPVSAPTATATPPTFTAGGTLSLSAKTLNFKIVGTDTERTLSFKIRNSGAGVLNGNVDASGLAAPLFMTSGARLFSLARGQSTTVTVQAAPDQPGAFSGTIIITSGDPKHPLAGVAADGVAAPGKIKVPAAVTFGKVKIGATAIRTIRTSNHGPGVLHGTVGKMTAPFSTVGSSFTLSQDQSVLVLVQFAPMSTQPSTAMLSISNDDPPSGLVDIPVTGTGK